MMILDETFSKGFADIFFPTSSYPPIAITSTLINQPPFNCFLKTVDKKMNELFKVLGCPFKII